MNKTDNATEKAFKQSKCPNHHCKEMKWFWQKTCEKCHKELIETLGESLNNIKH